MALGWEKVDMTNKGFTLIEVLISLTIFSIGMLSITGMLMLGRKGISGGSRSFTAVQAARAQMELLRDSAATASSEGPCTVLMTPTIDCTYSVKKVLPADGLSTVEVVTRWNEGEKYKELVLTYLRFDGGH